MPNTIHYDFASLSGREKYKLMIGAIVPRPIALVTTVDPEGRSNAAPFSFFNCLSSDPPILALGIENRPDMSLKHTARNIRLTEVFTVNIVSLAMAEAMHVCAADLPDGVSELTVAGLTPRPGHAVASPWISESPASFECRRTVTLELGKSRQIILGEIVHAHFHPEVVNRENLTVDPAKLDAIARLGGDTCCTIRDRREIPTPSVTDLLAGRFGVPAL